MGLEDVTRETIGELSESELEELEQAIFGETYEPLQRYCPERPFEKQKAFLDCRAKEVFFGGAAGPGKSSALLMAALRYVHVPAYSALILRRDFARLSLPGSIMARARQWLAGTDAKWSGQQKLFRFPSGATIQFGFVDNPNDRFRYASSEFQTILFDELSEFELADDESNPYLFLFSRLRKQADNPVPLQMLSASNPGNIGHAWVKRRFITDEATRWMMLNEPGIKVFYSDSTRERAFIPGLLRDNHAIRAEDYEPNLAHLPNVTRQRLLRGDWSIREDSLIQPQWARRYEVDDGVIRIYDASANVVDAWHEDDGYRFVTCDPAGTSADRARQSRGKSHSWSVIGVWERSPSDVGPYLILRYVWRRKVAFGALCDGLRQIYEEWEPARMRIENEKLGEAAVDVLGADLPIDTVPTGGKDKITRATPLVLMMERGEVALPLDAPWLEVYEQELFSWTGHPDEVGDQVDMSAYAAIEASGRGVGLWPAALFGAHTWLDEPPSDVGKLVTAVIPCPAEQTGQGGHGAIVTVGLTPDGTFIVAPLVSDDSPTTLISRLRETDQLFLKIPLSIVVPTLYAELADILGPTLYADATRRPQVFSCDLAKSDFRDPTSLSSIITDRRLRLLRSASGSRTFANRAKSFPHTKDIAVLQAFGIAIEMLAQTEVFPNGIAR